MSANGKLSYYYDRAKIYTVRWRRPMPSSALGRVMERRRRLYYRRRKYHAVNRYLSYRNSPVTRRVRRYRRPYGYRYAYY